MENPELILERFDALSDDEFIDLVKEALKEAGIPFIEKSNQSKTEATQEMEYDLRI